MSLMKLMVQGMSFIVVGMAENSIGRVEVVVREQVVVAFGVVTSPAVQTPAPRSVKNTRVRVLPMDFYQVAKTQDGIATHIIYSLPV